MTISRICQAPFQNIFGGDKASGKDGRFSRKEQITIVRECQRKPFKHKQREIKRKPEGMYYCMMGKDKNKEKGWIEVLKCQRKILDHRKGKHKQPIPHLPLKSSTFYHLASLT